MNFIQSSVDTASHDASFRRHLVKICNKCILYFPERQDFKDILHQSSQLIFLESDDCLEDAEREFLKTFYKNNEAIFLVCYQLWQKYSSGFFCLDEDTLKLAVHFETNKVKKKMLSLIKDLCFLHAKVTVLSETFF